MTLYIVFVFNKHIAVYIFIWNGTWKKKNEKKKKL